jgi:hypothetical protein
MSVDPQGVMPRRNPNLIERIANAVLMRTPDVGPQPAARQSTDTGVLASTARALAQKFLSVENSRTAVYLDVDEMDATSEETSTALDTIADNVTTSEDGAQLSWRIVCEDTRVLDALEACAKRSELHEQTFGLARNIVKRGDVFAEIVVNGSPDGGELWITRLKQLPPSTMVRNRLVTGLPPMGVPKYDDKGRLISAAGSHAFEQFDQGTNALVAAFLPWQIAHFRHNWAGERQYGESMLKTSRQSWRKLMAEETALVIARLMRAYMKLVWYVDTTGQSKHEKERALKAFQDSVQVSQRQDSHRDAPFSVMNDIFVSSSWLKLAAGEVKEDRTHVQPIDPKNEGMTQIADVEYIANKLLSTLRVPKAHMGFERDVNAKATLTTQDIQYVRFLRRVQQQLGQCLTQIFDTQLIVLGIDPQSVEYTIEWPRLNASDEAEDALATLHNAQADALYLKNNVVDAEWVMRERLGLDDEAVKELKERIQQQVEAQQQADADQAAQEFNQKLQAAAALKPNGNGTAAVNQEFMHELRRIVASEISTVRSRGGVSPEARLLAETVKARGAELRWLEDQNRELHDEITTLRAEKQAASIGGNGGSES